MPRPGSRAAGAAAAAVGSRHRQAQPVWRRQVRHARPGYRLHISTWPARCCGRSVALPRGSWRQCITCSRSRQPARMAVQRAPQQQTPRARQRAHADHLSSLRRRQRGRDAGACGSEAVRWIVLSTRCGASVDLLCFEPADSTPDEGSARAERGCQSEMQKAGTVGRTADRDAAPWQLLWRHPQLGAAAGPIR